MKNMANMKSDEEYYYGDDGKDNEDDYWDGHQPDFEPADDNPAPLPPPPTPPGCPQTPQALANGGRHVNQVKKDHLHPLGVCTRLAAAPTARMGTVAHHMLLNMKKKWMTV